LADYTLPRTALLLSAIEGELFRAQARRNAGGDDTQQMKNTIQIIEMYLEEKERLRPKKG
jgi:hypothetical protein